MDAGRRAEARAPLEKAVAGSIQQTADRAEARFALARAVDDRARATTLAREALAILQQPDGDPRRLAPQVEAWLSGAH